MSVALIPILIKIFRKRIKAKGFTYKKPNVFIGKISYNKKTRTLTWTITNLKVYKTKAATLTWSLKAKKVIML